MGRIPTFFIGKGTGARGFSKNELLRSTAVPYQQCHRCLHVPEYSPEWLGAASPPCGIRKRRSRATLLDALFFGSN
jgi:hypothetical protein